MDLGNSGAINHDPEHSGEFEINQNESVKKISHQQTQ
jgi:hypothetical protein